MPKDNTENFSKKLQNAWELFCKQDRVCFDEMLKLAANKENKNAVDEATSYIKRYKQARNVLLKEVLSPPSENDEEVKWCIEQVARRHIPVLDLAEEHFNLPNDLLHIWRQDLEVCHSAYIELESKGNDRFRKHIDTLELVKAQLEKDKFELAHKLEESIQRQNILISNFKLPEPPWEELPYWVSQIQSIQQLKSPDKCFEKAIPIAEEARNRYKKAYSDDNIRSTVDYLKHESHIVLNGDHKCMVILGEPIVYAIKNVALVELKPRVQNNVLTCNWIECKTDKKLIGAAGEMYLKELSDAA